MPSYKVDRKGFFRGVLYPAGSTLTTEKPLKPLPSWVKPIKQDSKTQREKKETPETPVSFDNLVDTSQVETL